MNEQNGILASVVDAGAIAITGGILLKLIPVIAGILSIIWLGIRIYEYFKNDRFVD